MKSRLLIFLSLIAFSMNAQTTHDLDWFAGIGNSVDLTIETGDTVRWTWTSPNHTVENVIGSSVETFNSGFLGPNGSTYEYTFTVIGDNDYFCGVHGAASMSGTILVQDNLSLNEESINTFKLLFNPNKSLVNVRLPQSIETGTITIHDITGKRVLDKKFTNTNSIELNVSNIKNGIYIFSVESNNIKQSKQFLKY